jgi:membrane protease YdiL (CAAX protease family)
MQRLTMQARQHPVIAFYVICYALTWALFLPLLVSENELFELLAVIGIFGAPGAAAIIVARTSFATPNREGHPPFWLSFVGSWIVCGAILLVYQRASNPTPSGGAYVIFGILAAVPAFIVASAFSGRPGVRRALTTLAHPGGRTAWYVLALILPLGVQIISVWLSTLLGWEFLSRPNPPSGPLDLAGSVLVVYLYTFVYAGGLNEEVGWTGFALPRLLARFNPLIGTVLVWGLWMLWHVPFHLAGYFDLNAHVLIGSFFGRFLVTWLFVRSSGGVLSAMLIHTSVNVTSQFMPVTYASLPVWAVIAILVVVQDKMWRRLPHENPAVVVDEVELREDTDTGPYNREA